MLIQKRCIRIPDTSLIRADTKRVTNCPKKGNKLSSSRVHHILGKRGHKQRRGSLWVCRERTRWPPRRAGRGAVLPSPTEHVGGTLSRIDYGVIPKDPDHIRLCRGNEIAGSRSACIFRVAWGCRSCLNRVTPVCRLVLWSSSRAVHVEKPSGSKNRPTEGRQELINISKCGSQEHNFIPKRYQKCI